MFHNEDFTDLLLDEGQAVEELRAIDEVAQEVGYTFYSFE